MTVPERHSFQVILERDEAGYFVAECLTFRACYAQGKTCAEVLANIRDVLELSARQVKEGGRILPHRSEIIGIERIEVTL